MFCCLCYYSNSNFFKILFFKIFFPLVLFEAQMSEKRSDVVLIQGQVTTLVKKIRQQQ